MPEFDRPHLLDPVARAELPWIATVVAPGLRRPAVPPDDAGLPPVDAGERDRDSTAVTGDVNESSVGKCRRQERNAADIGDPFVDEMRPAAPPHGAMHGTAQFSSGIHADRLAGHRVGDPARGVHGFALHRHRIHPVAQLAGPRIHVGIRAAREPHPAAMLGRHPGDAIGHADSRVMRKAPHVVVEIRRVRMQAQSFVKKTCARSRGADQECGRSSIAVHRCAIFA